MVLVVTATITHVILYFCLRNQSFTAYNNFSDNNNEDKLEKYLRTYKSTGLSALKELEFFLKEKGHWRADNGVSVGNDSSNDNSSSSSDNQKIFNRKSAKKLCVGVISGTRESLHRVTERESAGDINSPLIECVSSLLCGIEASMQNDIKIIIINTQEPLATENQAIDVLRPLLRVDDSFTTTPLYKENLPAKKDEREDITSLKRILLKRLKGLTDYGHATNVLKEEMCEWNLVLQADAIASRTKYPWAKELLTLIDNSLSSSSSIGVLGLFTESRSLVWSILNPNDYKIFYQNGLSIALVLWIFVLMVLHLCQNCYYAYCDYKSSAKKSKGNNNQKNPFLKRKFKGKNKWLQEWNENFSVFGIVFLFILALSMVWVVGKANLMKTSSPSMVTQYPMPVWTKSFGMATANLYKGRNMSVLYNQIVKEVRDVISNASLDIDEDDDNVVPTMDKIIYNFVQKIANDEGDAAEIAWTRPALFQRTGLFGSSQLELDLPPSTSQTSTWSSLGQKRGAVEGGVLQQMALTRNFPEDGLPIVFDYRTWES